MTLFQAFKNLYSLARHFFSFRSNFDHSFFGEFSYVSKILARLNINGGFIVDIAASDGVSQSCTLGFLKAKAWTGLLVEMDPIKFSRLSFVYGSKSGIKLARNKITPTNICPLFLGYDVPKEFIFLNLDIDSYDLHIIEAILKGGYTPIIISIEVNEKIPPPIFFTVDFYEEHLWKGDHFYGCSLTAACEIIRPFGYVLESLQMNNAIFIHKKAACNLFDDMDSELAYKVGYKNRGDRFSLFPYNGNLECLQNLSKEDSIIFLSSFFSNYSGKFTIK